MHHRDKSHLVYMSWCVFLFLNQWLMLCFEFFHPCSSEMGFSVTQTVKNLPAILETQIWFNPWIRKIPWRREWLPTPVFLPGEFHGQRSLAGYSPWAIKSQTSLSDFHFHQDICLQFFFSCVSLSAVHISVMLAFYNEFISDS